MFYAQLRDMREERRAWVGRVSAGLVNVRQKGKPVAIIVKYHKTGKEPAIDLYSDITPYIVTSEEYRNGTAANHIAEYVKRCRATVPVGGNQVVSPTANFSYFITSKRIEGDLIDWHITYG